TMSSRETADLDGYIKKCHPFSALDTKRPIFGLGPEHQPQLQRSTGNRILLFPGCFYPPHPEHETFLYHTYKSLQRIHVIAAIVLPLYDEEIKSKSCVTGAMNLPLTKEQRVRLWRGDGPPKEWYWIYDRSIQEWDSFRCRLAESITQDGFDVKFTVLYGLMDACPPWKVWDCDEIAVSNTCGPTDFSIYHTRSYLSGRKTWGSSHCGAQQRTEFTSWIIRSINVLRGKSTAG
ncbi:hypothetical protein P152DRAFT_394290, partial [Eremomyces bilateralis CBS 781.70]